MRVFVDGLSIPNTNQWILADNWKPRDLIADVLKVVDKTQSPDSYYLEGYEEDSILVENTQENGSIVIKRR